MSPRAKPKIAVDPVVSELRKLQRLVFALMADPGLNQQSRVELLTKAGFDQAATAEMLGTTVNVVSGQVAKLKKKAT